MEGLRDGRHEKKGRKRDVEFETQIEIDWGGKKRLFKCVDVQLEIKFSKAEIMFKKSILNDVLSKSISVLKLNLFLIFETLNLISS